MNQTIEDEPTTNLFPVVYGLDGLSCPGVQLAFRQLFVVCADLAERSRQRASERRIEEANGADRSELRLASVASNQQEKARQ